MLRRGVLAAVVVGLMTAGPAAAKPVKVPRGWVGMLVDGPMISRDFKRSAQELRLIRAARVGTIRVSFNGFELQHGKGDPIDLARTDVTVLGAASNGLRLLPVVVGSPPWARQDPTKDYSSPTPEGRLAYAALCQALVRRYGPRGTLWAEHPELTPVPIRQWQIWNEPNLEYYWHEQGSSASSYTKLLALAHTVIKAEDPDAVVMVAGIPSGGAGYLRRLYAAGAKGSFEAVATHPFTFKVSNVLRIIRSYRRALNAHGDRRVPIVVSELSWPSSYGKTQNNGYGFEVTEAEQARRVREAYLLLAHERLRLGIGGVYWSTWLTRDRSRTVGFDYSGLRRVELDGTVTAKPAYRAFVKVIRRLRGA